MEEGDMPVRDGSKRPLICSIDDGTKTVRIVIYEAERSDELTSYQIDKTVVQPQEGWYEQDPLEIIHHIRLCAENAIHQLSELGYSKDDIVTIGVTNQRETTIAWDKYTGQPLHPAIAWNDIRTDSTVDAILAKVPDRNKNYLKQISGLPISPYFSALKMRWLKDNVKAIRKAGREKRLMFGTVDSWIVWNLTGGISGGLHITDVTNASRTLLMNLDTLNWDPMLCRLFGIHRDCLPQIKSSSEIYGEVKDQSVLDGITISGILGNQQSALLGQGCVQAGQGKNTYRSGCFLLCNTGTARVDSTHGLLTTVAYRLQDQPPVYALEGSVAVAGSALKFLRDNLKLIKNVSTDTEHIAGQVFSTGDVYFVPAFSGLYAPYWRKDARGIICGLTAFTTKNHIIRAALEAVCFQTRDILEAMTKDCAMQLSKLHVDGNMSSNDLLMQLQADLIGIPVLRAQSWDMSALGVAVVAGAAVNVWSIDAWRHTHVTPSQTFLPTTTDCDRDARYTKWKMAVQRSLGWATTKKSIAMTGQAKRKSSMFQQSFDLPSPTDSRKNSGEIHHLDINVPEIADDGVDSYVEELVKYAARKFSIFVSVTQNSERTILDDVEYFMDKNECDYGMCECCRVEKKIQTNWNTIEEIIENDPEIIFDCDDNPIIVERVKAPIILNSGSIGGINKRLHVEKLPVLFKTIGDKLSDSSLT